MPNNRKFKAQINPLAFIEAELPSPSEPSSISAETILSFLCPPGTLNDTQSLVERYKRITAGPTLFAAPAEPRILEKLVWPLRHAKASYVVGNNLSVVALCGMVAEMVAVLLWKLAEPKLNSRAMTEEDEKALLGSTFEKLSQDRRVKVLRAYGIIESDIANDFDTIRQTRRQYLHLWSHRGAALLRRRPNQSLRQRGRRQLDPSRRGEGAAEGTGGRRYLCRQRRLGVFRWYSRAWWRVSVRINAPAARGGLRTVATAAKCHRAPVDSHPVAGRMPTGLQGAGDEHRTPHRRCHVDNVEYHCGFQGVRGGAREAVAMVTRRRISTKERSGSRFSAASSGCRPS